MSEADALIGQKFGTYEIQSLLGKGGMATVYKARHSSLNRTVAVKVLPRAMLHDDTFMQRFRREAELIARLENLHILPIFDYGEQDGMPYLVMRFLEGGTLKERIEQGPMPWEDIVSILSQVASALDYAHSRNVIHRDIKPSNILLDNEGNAYLADFGIAKIQEGGTQLTGSGIIGTPAYMAPEQSSAGVPTPSMDVYALGVTLFEMITGRVPYQSDTPIAQILMHLQEPIPSLREYNPEISEAVDNVMRRAMAKTAEQRFQSPGELARALKAATRQGGWGWSEESLQMAEQASAGAVTRGPRLLESRTEVGTLPAQPAGRPAPTAPARRGASFTLWYIVGGVALVVIAAAIIGIALLMSGGTNQGGSPTEPATVVAEVGPEEDTPPADTPEAVPAPTEAIANAAGDPTATMEPTAAPTALPATTTLRGINMILIPAGPFTRGTTTGNPNERPERTITLSAYYIDETEVTNLYWQSCVEEGGCATPEFTSSPSRFSYYGTDVYENYPVLYISWTEAQAYCRWRGGHLPTEAQWEKAARWDPVTGQSRMFPWSSNFLNNDFLNYNSVIGDTTEVKYYPLGVSALGLYDMSGNVAEWVFDWYQDNFYEQSPDTDPIGPISGSLRVIRGGSFESRGGDLTATARTSTGPDTHLVTVGFRCAFTPGGDPTLALDG